MNIFRLVFPTLLVLSQAQGGEAKTAVSAAVNAANNEDLRYSVNWPSGLSLGESHWTAQRSPSGWDFTFRVEAMVPGFGIEESAKSSSTNGHCSIELEKKAKRGKRTIDETTVFDSKAAIAVRTAQSGGKSEIPVSTCARDALTYLAHLRSELAQGRLPASQKVLYGAPYQVKATFGGAQKIRVADESVEADRLLVAIKGPRSDFQVELFLGKDPARTLLLVKVPLPLGKFAMELIR